MNAATLEHFAQALLDPERPVPALVTARADDAPLRGFNVYRNNVVVSLVDALAERFPVCELLVGRDFFRAMAREYVRVAPPTSPLMMTYGDGFPEFIAAFGPAGSVPYLADVARVEAARTRAYHAGDAEPLEPADFAARDGAALAASRMRLHPSAEAWAAPFAAASLWAAHQQDDVPSGMDPDVPEDILVARPDCEVEVRILPPGGAAFVAALGAGATLADAAGEGASAAASFDPAAVFAIVIAARIVTAFDNPT